MNRTWPLEDDPQNHCDDCGRFLGGGTEPCDCQEINPNCPQHSKDTRVGNEALHRWGYLCQLGIDRQKAIRLAYSCICDKERDCQEQDQTTQPQEESERPRW